MAPLTSGGVGNCKVAFCSAFDLLLLGENTREQF